MNIFFNDQGFWKNKKKIEKSIVVIEENTPLDIHITSYRKVSVFGLALLVLIFKNIRSIELTQDIKKSNVFVRLFANANNSFSYKLIVQNKLSNKQKVKIKKLKGLIHIYDTTNENQEFYESFKKVIYKDKEKDLIEKNNIYSIIARYANDCCYFSSCLGKNLYISNDYVFSFCPFNTKETEMTNQTEKGKVFSDIRFIDALNKAISRRKGCKSCVLKTSCRGYCVLKDNCMDFQNSIHKAKNELDNHLKENTNLSTIPLYLEQAVLYYLFNNK